MKRRGAFLKGLIAVFIVLAMSITCAAQTAKPQPQPPTASGEQAKKDVPKGQPQWRLYMGNETRRYYFDSNSLERLDKRVVRVWERITEPDKDGNEVERVQTLMELDCGSSKYRIIAEKEFGSAKPGEKPEARMENGPWTYFEQDTILGILQDNVCYPLTTPAGVVPPKPVGSEEPPKRPTFKN
ncbi:MAG: hypothetical protein GXX82_06800 [Syntrophorhabdus sp.]|nr:hypothetical protein [Syntrophorhabdus sp.]